MARLWKISPAMTVSLSARTCPGHLVPCPFHGDNMNRTIFLLGAAVLGITSCSNAGPDAPSLLTGPPLTARGGGAQTLYTLTFLGGIGNDPAHALSGTGKTGDPFSSKIGADPAYLSLPSVSGGDPAVCNQSSGEPPSTGTWGAYSGVWKGSFSVTAKGGGGYTHHVAFGAAREDGTGFLWLVVNARSDATSDNLNLRFTNVRGLVSAGSTPDGGPVDPQDRCLTFSITATP
jgi:hypothetical protein